MNILKNLSDREKRFFLPAVVGTVFVSVFLFVDFPLYRNIEEFKKKLSSLKPTTTPVTDLLKRTKVELYFEKVSISEASRLLTTIETDWHPVVVEKVSIKATYENPSLFNLTLLVNTAEKN